MVRIVIYIEAGDVNTGVLSLVGTVGSVATGTSLPTHEGTEKKRYKGHTKVPKGVFRYLFTVALAWGGTKPLTYFTDQV